MNQGGYLAVFHADDRLYRPVPCDDIESVEYRPHYNEHVLRIKGGRTIRTDRQTVESWAKYIASDLEPPDLATLLLVRRPGGGVSYLRAEDVTEFHSSPASNGESFTLVRSRTGEMIDSPEAPEALAARLDRLRSLQACRSASKT